MGKMIELTAADGHRLAAYLAEPAGTPRGAVVVVQEIFGVNSHIRSVADGYAADGYLAIAPALFDRVQRDFQSDYTQADMEAGFGLMQKVSWEQATTDVTAAMNAVRHAGKVGIVGFCWGGAVTWVSAARVPGLAAAVPYYGGAIPTLIGEKPACPTMLHFGEHDPWIPLDKAQAVVAAHPEVTAWFYPTDHGFNCDQRGSYDAAAATLARSRTLEFFRKHVG